MLFGLTNTSLILSTYMFENYKDIRKLTQGRPFVLDMRGMWVGRAQICIRGCVSCAFTSICVHKGICIRPLHKTYR